MTRPPALALLVALAGCTPTDAEVLSSDPSCCGADAEDPGEGAGSDDSASEDGGATDSAEGATADTDVGIEDTGAVAGDCADAPVATIWLCVEGVT